MKEGKYPVGSRVTIIGRRAHFPCGVVVDYTHAAAYPYFVRNEDKTLVSRFQEAELVGFGQRPSVLGRSGNWHRGRLKLTFPSRSAKVGLQVCPGHNLAAYV